MVRVPTYASYMSLVNQTMKTKATANMYSYQTSTGIKYANYAGYGMKASNIVNMEASLNVTQNFLDNNTLLNTSIKTMSTVMENVEDAVSSFKSQLNNAMSVFSSLTDGEPISTEVAASLNELQTVAFSAMSLISDALNQSVGGKYIFGAGSSSEPSKFPYSTLDEFQKMYDGINIQFPETSNALLANRQANYALSGDLTIAQGSADNEFVLSATNGFLSTAVIGGENTTGDLTFSAADDSLHAMVYGAFNSIHAGDILMIDNNGSKTKYTVESVSADGKTLKFAEDVTADSTITDGTGVTVSTSFAVGTVLDFEGNSAIPSPMQVLGMNDSGELTVRADNAKLSTSLPQTLDASSHWSLSADSYYQGGSAQETFRVSDNQSITFDINANDPVFTKLFRAFGMIAQGNLIQTNADGNVETGQAQAFHDLIDEAMGFLQSAIDNNGKATSGKNETISMCVAKISANYVTLNNVNNTLNNLKNNLEDNVYDIKNVDQTEAAAKLLFTQNSLEASYQVLNSTLNLSLLDYLK